MPGIFHAIDIDARSTRLRGQMDRSVRTVCCTIELLNCGSSMGQSRFVQTGLSCLLRCWRRIDIGIVESLWGARSHVSCKGWISGICNFWHLVYNYHVLGSYTQVFTLSIFADPLAEWSRRRLSLVGKWVVGSTPATWCLIFHGIGKARWLTLIIATLLRQSWFNDLSMHY